MKADLKKLDCYQAKVGEFRILDVPPMQYMAIDGRGNPNTSKQFRDAFGLLYPFAYTLKFLSKKELEKDYAVPPPEALWWADDMDVFAARDKDQWQWTLMIMVPDWLHGDHVDIARESLRHKKPDIDFDQVRFMTLDEGLSVQTLFVGPYDEEGPVISEMHQEFMPGNGLKPTGKHHEIYFSDMRRVAPEKYRTIIRQPVEKI